MSMETMHVERPKTTDPTKMVCTQFIDRKQQDETYLVGMWAFLVQEIMFFGALFLAYIVFRTIWPGDFSEISREHLNVTMGLINTFILLTSSLTMAMAVQSAQRKLEGRVSLFMMATIMLALAFMVVKFFEYKKKYDENHIPGPLFHYEVGAHGGSHATAPEGEGAKAAEHGGEAAHTEAEPAVAEHGHKSSLTATKGRPSEKSRHAEIFFSLYFIMTGLHGIHVVLGVVVMVVILIMLWSGSPLVKDYMPIEMTGLYWHFVDIVWIFLYPVLYLANPDPSKFLKF
jgi:cytochrome c oxidase subunit 3